MDTESDQRAVKKLAHPVDRYILWLRECQQKPLSLLLADFGC